MVIQEAYQFGRPVLAPRLGGMAEKIKHNQTGLLFGVGNSSSLALHLRNLYYDRHQLAKLAKGSLDASAGSREALQNHRQIYHQMLDS